MCGVSSQSKAGQPHFQYDVELAGMSEYGTEEISRNNCQGVEGWLLLLCCILIFVVPTNTIYEIFAHALPLILKTHDPKREILWSVYVVLFLVVAVGLVIGVRLWMICGGAVWLARVWLLTSLCAHVSYFFFWLVLFRRDRACSVANLAGGSCSRSAGSVLFGECIFGAFEGCARHTADREQCRVPSAAKADFVL